MLRKFALLVALSCVFAVCVCAQGLNTQASKDDWEEINFEFNSAVLSDGYPSLLRLADLLHSNPTYHVRVEGNTDNIGSERGNQRLGLARANTVRDFLVKYGANPTQIDVASRGKNNQKYPGYKNRYSRTDVPRWMNRRVVLTVTDQNGRTVGAGGVGEAIQAIPPPAAAAEPKCCDDVLKRLDQIAQMLKDMTDQNNNLRQQLDALRNQQNALQGQVNGLPKPLTEEQESKVVDARLLQNRDPRFSLLGLNYGADDEGHFTFDGGGRFFAPFKDKFAIQAQGEFLYFRDHKETQADIGLVNRLANIQLGIFGSFKNVDLGGIGDGNLLQASAVMDYIFRRGKVGIFGSKGFLTDQYIGRTNTVLSDGSIAPNLFTANYLRVVDQIGGQGTIGLWRNTYMEANLGYLHSVVNASRPGGSLRFVFPFGQHFGLTVEGGLNEDYLTAHNTGRATFGILFGNLLRPKEFALTDRPVPMQVPEVRYETYTRKVHQGVSPPIADAGPDQIGVPAGTITLNGSGSRDPNGEALTYQWVQESGPAVSISGANQAVATFQAASGRSYTFRLTVRNTDGQQASARVNITAITPLQINIARFTATPPTINAGQSANLRWTVRNATKVSIAPGIGNVNPGNGSVSVSPTATTTYTLTASNANGQERTQTVTVTVNTPQPQFSVCTVTPGNISQGESATINFRTLNATSVSISPSTGAAIGTSGKIVVSPTETTSYTLIATNSLGSANCSLTVQVTTGNMPRIVSFTASPLNISAGSTSMLMWSVENATSVSIDNGVGTVKAAGSTSVSPTANTTYTLTATNSAGTVTQKVSISVSPGQTGQPPKINSFTATPGQTTPGSPVVLSCSASNASSVVISGIGPVDSNGNRTVNPQTTTTYVCVAVGPGGVQQASANATVTVGPPTPGQGPGITISSLNANCTPSSGNTEMCVTVVRQIDLNLSATSPNNGPLTFNTTSTSNAAAVLDPSSTNPTVQLAQNLGNYYFTVLVKDAQGNQSTETLVIRYAGSPSS